MKKFGLKQKVALYCVLFITILTIALGFSSYERFKKSIMEKYHGYAETILGIAGSYFDKYGIVEDIPSGIMDDGYQRTREELNMLKEHADVAYIYAVYFRDFSDPDSLCFIINGTTEAERTGKAEEEVYSYMGEACEEGDFDQEMRGIFISALKNGTTSTQFYENYTEEYGNMLTCFRVLRDGEGNPAAIISTDLDVNDIWEQLREYFRETAAISLLTMVLVVTLFIIFIHNRVTGPITRISDRTDEFVKQLKENVTPDKLRYREVSIYSKDEIHLLSEDIRALTDSVKIYMSNLESVTAEKQRISSELSIATNIQADMLPRIFPCFPDRNEFVLYASMDPAKEVGGDFYDFFLVDDDHLCMVMADVSGKGVPAALFMVISKTLIKNRAQMGDSPAEILRNVNTQLIDGNKAELFVTVWVAILELSTGKGVAANAGHEHPAIRRGNGPFELSVYRHSPALATMEGLKFREHEFRLNPGDYLFVYTDGVPEATNANNELFGNERMLATLNSCPKSGPEDFIRAVKRAVSSFVGDAPQFDDITMLALKYEGPCGEKGETAGTAETA